MNAIDIGTYTSEELIVAGRPAMWDPVDNGYPTLDVDAGGGDLFRVYYQMDDRAAESLRDPAVAIAEAVIPRLAAVGAPPTVDCSTLTIEEVASATGLPIISADGSTGEGCAYGVDGTPGSFLVSVIPAEVAANYGMALTDPERTEIAGQFRDRIVGARRSHSHSGPRSARPRLRHGGGGCRPFRRRRCGGRGQWAR